MLNFLGQCNFFQMEFHNGFDISVILTYDIHNKISKLGHFGHFNFGLFWPHLEAIEKFLSHSSSSNG